MERGGRQKIVLEQGWTNKSREKREKNQEWLENFKTRWLRKLKHWYFSQHFQSLCFPKLSVHPIYSPSLRASRVLSVLILFHFSLLQHAWQYTQTPTHDLCLRPGELPVVPRRHRELFHFCAIFKASFPSFSSWLIMTHLSGYDLYIASSTKTLPSSQSGQSFLPMYSRSTFYLPLLEHLTRYIFIICFYISLVFQSLVL